MSQTQLFICLGIGWFGYFAIHSLLATVAVKTWFSHHLSRWSHGYRLFYNLLATLLLLPLLWLTLVLQGEALWQFNALQQGVAYLLSGLAILGFILSLREYDGAEFSGIKQWQAAKMRASSPPQPRFCLGFFHRFVRHPWYFFGLILIWSHEMDVAMLLGAVMMSGYFVVGSSWEERRLIAEYGAVYQHYRQRVPGLLPRPWRYLSRLEAQQLLGEGQVSQKCD
ncbi:MAG: hypothetical protein HQL49_03390 [Gammaproteobacteria bacterium]|nr:hypothetical protein [Gammaproteobacteria bacterium]